MVTRDDHPRSDTTEEKLAGLKPVFDREFGSVTAGNSSPLTDGASAVLLAAEDVARAEGWPILGLLRGYHYTAIDPFEHLLMGPVSAIAGVLDQTGLGLRDLGVIDMHEAFAAQVLANLHGLASASYCQEKLGRPARSARSTRRSSTSGAGASASGTRSGRPAGVSCCSCSTRWPRTGRSSA
jgi:acetyl-CoA acyltransferase